MKKATFDQWGWALMVLLWLVSATHSGTSDYMSVKARSEPSVRLKVKVEGTGRTTGHVVSFIVENESDVYLAVKPQTAYVPSNGQLQDYIVSIAEGFILPPRTISQVPGVGYCGSGRKPPSTGPLPPTSSWTLLEDPVGPYPHSVPVPMRGLDDTVRYSRPPVTSDTISLIPGLPSTFKYVSAHPGMEHIPGLGPVSWFVEDNGAHKTERAEAITDPDVPDPYMLTYPGTDRPINGYYTEGIPDSVWAPVLLDVVRRIEQTVPEIQATGLFPTPFSSDPVKEMDAITQQVIWIYTAGFFGNDYTKDEFVNKTYQEAERSMGVPVEELPEEQRSALKTGVDQFWASFTATGTAAKLIDTKAGLENTGISEEGEDYLYNLVIRKKEGCQCDSISYRLLVERGGFPILDSRFPGNRNPRVYVDDLTYDESFNILIGDIRVHCACGISPCQFYPEKSPEPETKPSAGIMGSLKAPFDRERGGQADIRIVDDGAKAAGPTGNLNCRIENDGWVDEDRSEYGFTLRITDDRTKNPAIFQRFQIVSWCDLENCLYTRCSEYITISFINIK